VKSYSVKLIDQDENSKLGYLIRKTELTTGGKKISGLVKIPRYPNKKLGLISPINEAVITLTLKEIEEIDGKNELRTSFISDRVRNHLNRSRINVVFVRISRADGTGFIKLKENVNKIAAFVVDIIYSHPMVDIVTLPYIEFLNNDSTDDLVEFDNLIGARISEMASLGAGGGKIGYFLPSYYTRDGIPRLIESYISRFGEEGVYICDFEGGTFSGTGYSLVSQVSRKVAGDTGSEAYALYVYSQKEKKKSGGEVSSEDLLALMNEASIVGPSHKRPVLPKEIVEKLKQDQVFNPKMLYTGDFLFYQYSDYKGTNQFNDWVSTVVGARDSVSLDHRKRLADIYNGKKTQEAVEKIIADPKETINSLERDDFKNELKQVNSRMRRIK